MVEATHYHWSRAPGKFMDKTDGTACLGASFTGTVREWYETLIEIMIDVSLTTVRKRGGGPIHNVSWRCDATVMSIIACSVLTKVVHDPTRLLGTIGEEEPLIVCNMPIYAKHSLYGGGAIQFYQNFGEPSEVLLGSVQIHDMRV